ncbi:MFS general substrate transporter [Fragilariopsis cylindrus CCMP1102]|uniref:MFS general substrate transporter n=1 Tax=Fragilariopsis cylindrus CCMP1102 TaxID=635003 RepID=A0A1E7FSU0_9STRA|nr:MFS general substrate transporter [Fragilariopsis cylindrus CCMP1102]|eukprot:OEU21229.1 MFS general substrate transporter [Fragilariopsis cylindrus CCMP1102]
MQAPPVTSSTITKSTTDNEIEQFTRKSWLPVLHTATQGDNNNYFERNRSWILLLLSLVIVSLSGGLVYGWPLLRRQLQDDGSTLTEKQFGLIYTIGSWSTQGGRFFIGILRDRYGTKRMTCLSLIFLMIGLIGVGLCNPNQLVVLSISLLLIGLGSGSQLCVQPVAVLFPNNVGIVLSTLSGAFNISGLIFLILANNTRKFSFLVFAGSILFLTIVSAIILPKSNSFSLQSIPEEADTNNNKDDKKHEQDDAKHKLPTAFEQMKTTEYILLLTWFSICIVPLQYYVGIIGYQLEEMGDDTGLYTDIFAYIYAGAAIASPIAGYIADKYGLGVAQGLSTLLVAGSLFFLAASASISLNVQTIGITLYGIGRMFIFGLYFTNCGKRFGYSNFGTLAGLGLLISAICSLLQYVLISWTVSGYGAIVNTVLGAILIAQAPYFGWLYRREKLYESAISIQQKNIC